MTAYRAPDQPDWTPELEAMYQQMTKPRVSGLFVGMFNAVLIEGAVILAVYCLIHWGC